MNKTMKQKDKLDWRENWFSYFLGLVFIVFIILLVMVIIKGD